MPRRASVASPQRHRNRQPRVLSASLTAEGFIPWDEDDAQNIDTISAVSAATEYFHCFNMRDVDGMLSLLAEDCTYSNYAYNGNPVSRKEMSHVLKMMVANLPKDFSIVIDQTTGKKSSSVGVLWHAEINRTKLVNGQGITFMRLNGQGLFDLICDAPEHTVKASFEALPTLNMAASLFSNVATAWTPLLMEGQQREAASLPGSVEQARTASRSMLQDPESLDSAPRLRLELKKALAEKEALERRLKQLLGRQRASYLPKSAPGSSQPGASRRNDVKADMARVPMASSRPVGTGPAGTGQSGPSPLRDSQGTWQQRQQGSATSAKTGAGNEAPPDPTGVWIKDTEGSDLSSYERALNMMGLSGLQKTTALRLIEGLEIRRQGSTITVQFLTVVPFFKVTEEFSTTRETTMPRRDLRPGQQTARTAFVPEGLKIDIAWSAPYACTVEDLYELKSSNTLHVTSRVTVGGRTETTLQVYHRREQWQPRFTFGSGLFGG